MPLTSELVKKLEKTCQRLIKKLKKWKDKASDRWQEIRILEKKIDA